MGMEVYYGTYPPSDVEAMAAMAARHGLIPCGGSDYHALGTPGEAQPGAVGPPLEIAQRLYDQVGEKVELST